MFGLNDVMGLGKTHGLTVVRSVPHRNRNAKEKKK